MEEENLQFDFRADLHHISCPVLLMAGKDDGAHPLESAIETAESIPSHLAQLHIIEDTGTPVYNDQPEKVLAILKDFLILNIQLKEEKNAK